MQGGNLKAAVADAQRAIAIDPKHSKAHMVRGLVELADCSLVGDTCDLEKAIVSFNRAIQLLEPDADKTYVYYLRGTVHMLKDDVNGAISDFSKVLEIEPDGPFTPYLLLMRGSARAAGGNYEAAIKDFDMAVSRDPTNPMFYFARGKAHSDNEDNSAAITDYTKALDLMNETATKKIQFGSSPIELANIYEARSEAYTSIEDYAKAFADLTEWIKLKPGDVDPYYARAVISMIRGNTILAVKDYNEIIKLAPDDAKAYLKRGEASVILGDRANSITDFRKAIQLTTDTEIRQRAESRLLLLGVKN
jgi:tetratricopeptide (TPR) repeat protein